MPEIVNETTNIRVQRVAVVDIGTNSVLLLIADLTNDLIQSVYEDQKITRLGEGIDQTGQLKLSAIERTVATIDQFIKKAKDLGAGPIHLIATSAMRDARNAQEFHKVLKKYTELVVTTLSGDQEAEASFWGALASGVYHDDISLVIDCGGGSTELICGNQGNILQKLSLNIGSVRLTDRFVKSYPVGDSDFASMTAFLYRFFHHDVTAKLFHGKRTIGIGGTMVTLAAISAGIPKHDPAKIDGQVLSRTEIWGLLEKLRQLPLDRLKCIPGLPPARADIIVAGCAIYATLLNYLDIEKIIVSTRGVRYGVLKTSVLDDHWKESLKA